MILISIKGLSW